MAIIFRPVVIPSWIDANGGTRDSFWTSAVVYSAVPTNLQNTVNAAAGISKAGLLATTYQVPTVSGGSGAANTYNVGDAATFYLTSSAGIQGVISVPDLDPAILEGDTVTISLTDSAVSSFLSYVMAYLGDTSGNLWTVVRQANRTRFPG